MKGGVLLNQEKVLSQSVSDNLIGKIALGYYRPGSPLPPLRKLATEFGVSVRMMQLALRRLVGEGLVRVNLRGEALVASPIRRDRLEERIANFLAKRDALLDFRENLSILWADLFFAAIRLCGEEDLLTLEQLLKPAEPNGLPFLLFYQVLLQKLGNPLLDDFFWDVILYTYSDYPISCWDEARAAAFTERMGAHLYEILRLCGERGWVALREELIATHRETVDSFLATLDELAKGRPSLQIPYHWDRHPSQPQPCFSVATDLMRRSRTGEFGPGDYLPSCSQLAEEYGASPASVRMAVTLTNEMRVTESINGRGTRIVPENRAGLPDVAFPSVRRNLTAYLESLQLLSLTCNSILQRTFPGIPEGERLVCARRLRAACQAGSPIISALPAQLVVRYSSSAVVSETYGRLTELLAWGNGLRFADPERRKAWEPFTVELISALELGDAGRFAAGSERIYSRLLQNCREWMLLVGITEIGALALPFAGGECG